MNIKKLLVATDLSDNADITVEKAINYAHERNHDVVVVHVVESKMFDMCYTNACKVEENLKEDASKEKLNNYKQTIEQNIQKKYCTSHVVTLYGQPCNEILHYAEKTDADMIMLADSQKEYSSVKRFFIGTVTKDIINRTSIPVYISKKPALRPIKNIIVPVDMSSACKESIENTAALFPDAIITLLQIIQIPSEFHMNVYSIDENERNSLIDGIRSDAETAFDAFKSSLNTENTLDDLIIEATMRTETITETLLISEADLVVAAIPNTRTEGSTFIKIATLEIIEHAPCDVLVLPEIT